MNRRYYHKNVFFKTSNTYYKYNILYHYDIVTIFKRNILSWPYNDTYYNYAIWINVGINLSGFTFIIFIFFKLALAIFILRFGGFSLNQNIYSIIEYLCPKYHYCNTNSLVLIFILSNLISTVIYC